MEGFLRTMVSYAHEDAELSLRVARALRDHGVPVWFDRWELPADLPEDEVTPALDEALARMDALVVLETRVARSRRAQQVPGYTLGHAMAPPAGPLNDAPFLGHEQFAWIERAPPGKVVKVVRLDFETAPAGAPAADGTAAPRQAVCYRVMTTFGRECRTAERHPWNPEGLYPQACTLVGEEVSLAFDRALGGLPDVLRELRAVTAAD